MKLQTREVSNTFVLFIGQTHDCFTLNKSFTSKTFSEYPRIDFTGKKMSANLQKVFCFNQRFQQQMFSCFNSVIPSRQFYPRLPQKPIHFSTVFQAQLVDDSRDFLWILYTKNIGYIGELSSSILGIPLLSFWDPQKITLKVGSAIE